MKFIGLNYWFAMVSLLVLVHAAKHKVKTIFQDVESALEIYDSSFEDGDFRQLAAVLAFMKPRFTEVLRSPKLLDLDDYALLTLLAKNWIVEESEVFKAVAAYVGNHTELTEDARQALINQIHFVGMRPSDLENEEFQQPRVLPLKSALGVLAFIAERSGSDGMLRYPNQLARTNVALLSMGAETLGCNCREIFKDFRGTSYPFPQSMFVVKLGAVFTVNRIVVGVYEGRVNEVKCLMIETSVDNAAPWEHYEITRYGEGSPTFEVGFEPSRVRFIRISSCNEGNITFNINRLEVSNSPPNRI